MPKKRVKQPWEKSAKLLRKENNRGLPKEVILIVCEGTNTEPIYFKNYEREISSVNIEIRGTGRSTLSIVKRAIELKEEAIKNKDIIDQIWCVFDRDDHSADSFQSAFTLAKQHSIKIAYSIECFELWYILHFEFLNCAISRTQYNRKISKYIGQKYNKSLDLFNKLMPHQKIAIKNAKRLLKIYEHEDNYKNNPSTTVFQLVKELNKYIT